MMLTTDSISIDYGYNSQINELVELLIHYDITHYIDNNTVYLPYLTKSCLIVVFDECGNYVKHSYIMNYKQLKHYQAKHTGKNEFCGGKVYSCYPYKNIIDSILTTKL